MPSIQKVALVSLVNEKQHEVLSKKVVSFFKDEHNIPVYFNDSFAKYLDYPKSTQIEKIHEYDLVVALGGDGTILWTARYAKEKPIFGINAGYLGFLTACTLSSCDLGLERIIQDDYILEQCMRLKVTLDGKELPTALNEAYTTNELNAKICTLNIAVDGYNLGSHRLDGLLVSTPVGSTAYALSAGGSIIEPKIKAMQIVPVNSVMRRIRPFVVPGESKITITKPKNSEKSIVVVIDGHCEGKFKDGSILEVTKAKGETVFLRFPDYGFFNRLQDKLGF